MMNFVVEYGKFENVDMPQNCGFDAISGQNSAKRHVFLKDRVSRAQIFNAERRQNRQKFG